ncbi:MAG: polysaccharide deacetylase family protein [Polyangiaceae bacterium]
MNHAFTVDLEDWYQGIPVDGARKASAERRLHIGTERLLELLQASGARATFFALSVIAKEHPAILRQIAAAGHEIGSHGESHDLVYEMGPQRFREETRASIRDLEDCVGQPVKSYRAAYFSITERSMWALDILTSEGVRVDSSIFPVKNWRYGIPHYSRRPLLVDTPSGPLCEFPISTRQFLGRNVPTTGGAYFRLYPYRLTSSNIRASEREGMPVVFYLHPWELDPKQPVVRFRRRAMLTHYARLGSTQPKLSRLLAEFRFTTLSNVLAEAFPQLAV